MVDTIETPNLLDERTEKKDQNTVDRNVLLERTKGLAAEKSILDTLHDELKRHGYAGPTSIPRLVYLATFSRGLDRPCSLVLKGPSSSGKSFALEAALRYVAPSAYKYVSGMSEMALVNSGWDLRGMHLVIGEAAGMAQGRGRTFLRQLMSDGSVTYATVRQTKDGHRGEEVPKVQGPAGVIMTTTAQMLHPEDDTRFLSLHMDQSPERVRETLLIQAKDEASRPSDEELERWHALHEYCFTGVRLAYIPFSAQLAEMLPTGDHRVFRDFQQVQSLIKSHALLHKHSRQVYKERVIATPEDYAQVYALVEPALSQGLRAAVSPHIREIVETVDFCLEIPGNENGVSQSEVAQRMARNPSVVSRNVRAAIALGYIKNLNPSGPGREALLVRGNLDLPSNRVLPSPEELRAVLQPKKPPKPTMEEFVHSQRQSRLLV
jgi:hypothetical protein